MELVTLRPEGLYCPPGDFYIDPWRPVERAVITHAHADHARPGHRHYLAARPGAGVLRSRLGPISLQCLDYGEAVFLQGVRVSLHPAGHVLGSAQVRIEWRGEVWVASGDYKTAPDPTCAAFEPLPCHTFITECTFGLPIYRWESEVELMGQIARWWAANATRGQPSVLFCYAFGKAQRILAGLDASIGPIVAHGAVETLNRAYREAGVALAPTCSAAAVDRDAARRALVLAPPSVAGTPWLQRFGDASTAFASGWMRLRGARRRRALDRGFVLSDHADWPGLLSAILATGAQRVVVTHGASDALVRWLREQQGLQADVFATAYGDEQAEAAAVDRDGPVDAAAPTLDAADGP